MGLIPQSSNPSKVTPSKTGGISKSLLTPCRRLGLSRKVISKDKKTPGSLNVTPDSLKANAPNPTCTEITPQKNVETVGILSPVNSKLSQKKKKIRKTGIVNLNPTENEAQINKPNFECTSDKTNAVVEIKSSPGQDLKQKMLNSTASESTATSNKSEKSIRNKEVQISNITVVENVVADESKTTTATSSENTQMLDSENAVLKCNVSSNERTSKEKQNKLHKQQNKLTSGKSKRSFGKIFSLKKSTESSDSDDDFKPLHASSQKSTDSPKPDVKNLLNCSVQIERISPDVLKSKEKDSQDSEASSEIRFKSAKRKHIVYSSEDEDFVSTPSSTKSEKDSKCISESSKALEDTKIVKVDLSAIKKRIKEKEDKLSELKHAETYRKLHNIEELRKMTNVWKNGCMDVLLDLLPKLREHGEITMKELLQKLNIPEYIIKYDSEIENFVRN